MTDVVHLQTEVHVPEDEGYSNRGSNISIGTIGVGLALLPIGEALGSKGTFIGGFVTILGGFGLWAFNPPAEIARATDERYKMILMAEMDAPDD